MVRLDLLSGCLEQILGSFGLSDNEQTNANEAFKLRITDCPIPPSDLKPILSPSRMFAEINTKLSESVILGGGRR